MTTATSVRTATEPVPSWRPFSAWVARTQRLSPTFLRITFTGDDLDEFGLDGPDQRMKLYLPRPGHPLPAVVTTDWYDEYRRLDPHSRGYIRTYTIRSRRPELREIDVDFALHGDAGPASAWAEAAVPGDQIVLIGPNHLYDDDCAGYEWNPPAAAADILIVGDESAVPAVASVLASMRAAVGPDVRVRVLLEVPDDADVLELTAPAQAEVTWLPRRRPDGSVAGHGELLVDAVRATSFGSSGSGPAGAHQSMVDTVDIDLEILWEIAAAASSSVYAWVAGEAAAVKTIRRHLVNERGIDKGAVTFMGYWRLGRAES